jgi:nucleoside-diphosphate-sugar epimerase
VKQARSVVRPRRSADTIAVTGAAGPLGSALVARLARDPRAPKVLALDTERGQTPGVTWRVADVRDPVLATRLAGVDTVVHLATDRTTTTPAEQRRAVNVRGTEILLDAAAAAGVQRVVLLTSAMVYGARAANPVPLDEQAPLVNEPLEGLVGEWVAMEIAARARCSRRSADDAGTARRPPDVTVVRPASLVGPVADA